MRIREVADRAGVPVKLLPLPSAGSRAPGCRRRAQRTAGQPGNHAGL